MDWRNGAGPTLTCKHPDCKLVSHGGKECSDKWPLSLDRKNWQCPQHRPAEDVECADGIAAALLKTPSEAGPKDVDLHANSPPSPSGNSPHAISADTGKATAESDKRKNAVDETVTKLTGPQYS